MFLRFNWKYVYLMYFFKFLYVSILFLWVSYLNVDYIECMINDSVIKW